MDAVLYAFSDADGTRILQSVGMFVQALESATVGGVCGINLMTPRPVQPLNACVPIVVTLDGIVIEERPWQALKQV